MMTKLKTAAAIVALVLAAGPAAAAQGDFLVRLRAITVQPQEKVGPVLPTFPTKIGRAHV